MKATPHPVMHMPTVELAMALGTDGFARAMKLREEAIRLEAEDPLRNGWCPPIWRVCHALLDLPFCDASFARVIEERFGMTWAQWKVAMRTKLGFTAPIVMLLILGANRSSKSEYCAKTGQEFLTYMAKSNVYPYHMSNPRSIENQQSLYWKYMIPEWRVQRAGEDTYVKFKRKTGFSENSFINPIGSYCAFFNYEQDKATAVEGLEPNFMEMQELVPADWVETAIYRLATRNASAVVSFTPVDGYTPTVKLFCDGATVVRESIAYCLPSDNGGPDLARQIGLTEEELQEIDQARKDQRAATAPASRPEDCLAWLEEGGDESAAPKVDRTFGFGCSQLPPAQGRKFHKMPRVLKCVNPKLAVVFFHAGDNPYGNPVEVCRTAVAAKSTSDVRVRVYGKADKSISNTFPRFDRSVHVIPAKAIPTEGTNYLFMDPASDRNFFMTWARVRQESDFIYREWPGNYEIPGIGIPGPWTVPSGKKAGINDGARGDGQRGFGFGLLRYKFEIARLEGWEDFKKWCKDHGIDPAAPLPPNAFPKDDVIFDWDEGNGADEVIEERFVDSRAATDPRVEMDRPTTLQDDLAEIGLHFSLTPGNDINDGVSRINSALDYDRDEQQSFLNHPRLKVSDECPNTIYSLENWMNVDGPRGAGKDPIDNLRYLYCAECEYVDGGAYAPRGGHFYGQATPSMGSRRMRAPGARPVCMGPVGGRGNAR